MVKESCIKNNKSHKLVTMVQFPTQLATARTLHRSQGLSLHEMTFDPIIVV